MVYVLVSLKLVGFESLLVHCLLGSLVSLSSASLPVCLCLCIFVLVSSFPSSVSIFPSLCFIHVSQVPQALSLPRSSAFPTLLCQVRVSVCCSVCPVCFLLFCHYVDLSQLCSPHVSFFLVTLRSSVMFTPCLQISLYPRQVFMFKW